MLPRPCKPALLPLQLRDPDLHLSVCLHVLLAIDGQAAAPGAALKKDRLRVHRHLVQVPPNGKELARTAQGLRKGGERRWMEWKKEGCDDFIKVRTTQTRRSLNTAKHC